MKLLIKKHWFILFTILITIISMFYFAFSLPFNDRSGNRVAELFAQYGDFIGGTLGTMLTFCTIIYLIQQNIELKKEKHFEFLEKKYYKLIDELIEFQKEKITLRINDRNFIMLNDGFIIYDFYDEINKLENDTNLKEILLEAYSIYYIHLQNIFLQTLILQIQLDKYYKIEYFKYSNYMYFKLKPQIFYSILLFYHFCKINNIYKEKQMDSLKTLIFEIYKSDLTISLVTELKNHDKLLKIINNLIEIE